MKLDLTKTNGSSPPSNQRDIVTSAMEDPTIKAAIRRGIRTARVKKYTAVLHLGAVYVTDTDGARNESRDYVSDFEQATYLTLLKEHADECAALSPEQRPAFIERLAKRVAWREVYPVKREVPLAEPLDDDQDVNYGNSSREFACDNISLGGSKRHPNWLLAHAVESELIECIDRQREGGQPEEQPESEYERRCRILGTMKADWMLDYEDCRYESAKTSAERVRYCRLRRKLQGM